MAVRTFYFLTAATLVICAVIAVSCVPTTANNADDLANLDKSIDNLFSLEELQCPNKTKEDVKACVHIALNAKSMSVFRASFNQCIENGYRQCAVSIAEMDKGVRDENVEAWKENGSSTGSRRLRKREVVLETEKSHIAEFWIKKLASTLK